MTTFSNNHEMKHDNSGEKKNADNKSFLLLNLIYVIMPATITKSVKIEKVTDLYVLIISILCKTRANIPTYQSVAGMNTIIVSIF